MSQHIDDAPSGDVSTGSSSLPSGGLRSPGGLLDPAPASAPSRALALDALRVLRRLRRTASRPADRCAPAFGREVELIRRQLAPVGSRATLAASYAREAFQVRAEAPAALETDEAGPVRLAYALRWLELGDGATGPAWDAMLDPGSG